MGYTHYWYREKKIAAKTFNAIVSDFKKVKQVLDKHLKLCSGDGTGEPIITNKSVVFNGDEKCGHQQRNLGITWAADDAKGISQVTVAKPPVEAHTIVTMLSGNTEQLSLQDSDVAGDWFAGAKLNSRTCGGDCSHETFSFPNEAHFERAIEREGKEKGKYFDCTKTAYKPYDLAVNCFLIIAKHHLKDKILVHSDGTNENWSDAAQLCEKLLGFGGKFRLDKN
jgi:hypothetical protein